MIERTPISLVRVVLEQEGERARTLVADTAAVQEWRHDHNGTMVAGVSIMIGPFPVGQLAELYSLRTPDVDDSYQLARFMQARDARQNGAGIDGIFHPTWDEQGEPGQDEYLKDAAAYIAAFEVLGWKREERS